MSPDFFIIPIIMGQASSIIEALKTGIIFVDMALLGFFIFLFYNTDKDYVKDIYRRWSEHNKKSIVISTEVNNRSIKFKAIMFYLTQKNETVYRLKEDAEIDWETDKEKRSGYLVEQRKEFKLTEDIRGHIISGMKEKHRNAQHTELVDFNTLMVYTYTLSLDALQAWVDEKVAAYKEHLRHTTNDKQLFITARSAKPNESGSKKKKSSICIESVNWESAITFQNSYFQEMDTVLQKIDFFLNNKAWYQAKGIPYNLGILLHGEPGCGKTRFIKQLMNHTKRHGIDIKLNDGMDFHDLQHLIYTEELDETHIIPQDQRVLIFEDIDALGEVVKERPGQTALQQATAAQTQVGKQTACDTSNNDIKIISSLLKMSSENKNNNLSYLLNMLDGIHECSGRIIIMTTNKVDVLDKALIRPGRIDMKLHFKKCSSYDVAKMIEKFWDREVTEEDVLREIDGQYTSADIINIFRSTNDFETIKGMFIMG
jgi:ATP-dependent 26S proteasome regulatory subunit